jgi:hypothetical protein
MDKNIHNSDEFFKQAYREFEDTPSDTVWKNIDAVLDKKETTGNKKSFIVWKRTAIVLVLVFAGYAILDQGSFDLNNKNLHLDNIVPNQEQHKINSGIIMVDNSKQLLQKVAPTSVHQAEPGLVKMNAVSPNYPGASEKRKIPAHSKWYPQKFLMIQRETAMSNLEPGKEGNKILKNNEVILQLKIEGFPLSEKYSPLKKITALANGSKSFTIQGIKYEGLKYNRVKIKRQRKNQSFNPFWVMGAYASYDQVNYKLDSDLPDNIKTVKHNEKHEPSYSGGILIGRQMNQRWMIQSGLVYSYNAIGISPKKLFALQDPGGEIAFKYITSSGYTYIKPGLGAPTAIGDSLITTEGKHTLQFIRIPAMIKYNITKNKWSFKPGAGIEMNFLSSAKVETEIVHSSNEEIIFIKKLEGAKSFHLSVAADAGIHYQVNKKTGISLHPTFRYALTPITENNVVETFPYSFGMGLGISLKF